MWAHAHMHRQVQADTQISDHRHVTMTGLCVFINKYRNLEGYFDKTGPDSDADMKYPRPDATLDRRGGDREL